MSFNQRKTILQTFIFSHFSYCPLVWMFHSRTLNNRINRIHERALRIVYQDIESSFADLLSKDNSFTIHERNIQTLAIELYKVAYRISPKIMDEVFPLKSGTRYAGESIFETSNIKTVSWGTETLGNIGPRIWSIIPQRIKNLQKLSEFTRNIRKWKPEKCPCRLCKTYVKHIGFINVVN